MSYLWRLVKDEELQELKPKWLVSGFPKAGLHMLEQAVLAIAQPMPSHPMHVTHWWGTNAWGAWTNQFLSLERILCVFSRLREGHFYKGHVAWEENIERFLYYSGAAHVFMYRDLRDVAISQTHHVLADQDRWTHPSKATYMALEMAVGAGTSMGFDAALKAVIAGVGPFEGVVERWKLFAPWIETDWTFSIKYEDFLKKSLTYCVQMLDYGTCRVAGVYEDLGLELHIENNRAMETARMMKENTEQRERSNTFRRGQPGEWRNHFTNEIKDLWKEHDSGNWLVKLGYEEDDNW